MDTYKVILIGKYNCGKSSIINRYIHNKFDRHMAATIGGAYYSQIVNIKSKLARINIWDLAGSQSHYDMLLPMMFKSTHIILIVYDITSKESFMEIPHYLKKIHIHSTLDDVKMILVGNKFDLSEDREVTVQEAQYFANQNDLLFMECSAYQNYHIKELFDVVIKELENIQLIDNHNILIDKPIEDKYCCY